MCDAWVSFNNHLNKYPNLYVKSVIKICRLFSEY